MSNAESEPKRTSIIRLMTPEELADPTQPKENVWKDVFSTQPEDKPTKTVDDLLNFARMLQTTFAEGTILGGSELSPFETGTVSDLWDSMRQLGDGADFPEDPSGKLQTLDDVKRAVDEVIRWCVGKLETSTKQQSSDSSKQKRDDEVGMRTRDAPMEVPEWNADLCELEFGGEVV